MNDAHRTGKAWSPGEAKKLQAELEQETGIIEIARIHKRTPGAILAKAASLVKSGKITMDTVDKNRGGDSDGRRVSKDDAKRWIMAAFAETMVDGCYLATKLQSIPGAAVFQVVSKRIGLVERAGHYNKVITPGPPSDTDVESLYAAYIEYTSKGAQLEETKRDELTPTQIYALSRIHIIEEKIDAILSAWDIAFEVTGPTGENKIKYINGIARNRVSLNSEQQAVIMSRLSDLWRWGADMNDVENAMKDVESQSDIIDVLYDFREKVCPKEAPDPKAEGSTRDGKQ